MKANIPFLALPEQVYIPFLGILFSNKFRERKQVKADKMMPITQQVFLYLLYNKAKGSIMKGIVVDALGITRMSVTRASEQLIQMRLIRQEKIGREVYISCINEVRNLYELAKPFLINPIQKELYVNMVIDFPNLLKSGETALGERTMLNLPKVSEYAIYKSSESVKTFQIVDEK